MQIKRVPLRTGAAAVYPWDEEFAAGLILDPKYEDDVPIQLYRREGDVMWLPRELCPRGEDAREDGIAVDFNISFEPRMDQEDVIQKSIDLLRQDRSHIFQGPTGYGKTVCACVVIGEIGRRTMVITTKEDCLGQWRDAARSVLGVDPDIWRGDITPSPTSPIVVGLVQSVMKGPSRYSQAMYRNFGLVIVDEVHRIGADQFQNAMWWFPAKLRVGLSATPYRKDGRDPVFLGHIGPRLVSAKMDVLTPRIIARDTGWRVPRRRTKTGEFLQIPHKAGRVMHIAKIMAKNDQRNGMLVDFVAQAYQKGRSVLVFSDLIEHLRLLEDLLVDAGVRPKHIGYYVGLQFYEGPKKEREAEREAAKRSPVILATYKMASEATDIPWCDTCVLGTPKSDVVQIVGRIRREYQDKKVPVVFDMVDGDSPVFARYWRTRSNWYKKIGAEVKVY